MKNIAFILSAVLIFCSCKSGKDEKQNIQTMDPNDIRISTEVRHDSLTADQMIKVKKIYLTFADVYPVSLEETILNFRKDLDPDSEIKVWLQMADAYEKYINSKQGKLNPDTKKEVFKLILSRSMMPDEEAIANAGLVILTEKEAKEILSYYTLEPDPLEVIKKP